MEGVHDHSGACDALRRELALIVTEAEAEFGRAEKRRGKDAAVGGKMAEGQISKEVKSVVPWGPDPEGMKKSKQGGRYGPAGEDQLIWKTEGHGG